MKRLLPILLAATLMLPGAVLAKEKKAKAAKAEVKTDAKAEPAADVKDENAPAPKAKKAKKSRKASKGQLPEWAVESEKCSGDKDVKSISLGKEVVYVSEDLNSASFSKNEIHTLKHNLMYYSPASNTARRTPGVDSNGNVLVPAFKHGETWRTLTKDANGNVIIEGAPPVTTPIITPEPTHAKKAKKAKKGGKKAKGAKKGGKKAAEPAPAK